MISEEKMHEEVPNDMKEQIRKVDWAKATYDLLKREQLNTRINDDKPTEGNQGETS